MVRYLIVRSDRFCVYGERWVKVVSVVVGVVVGDLLLGVFDDVGVLCVVCVVVFGVVLEGVCGEGCIWEEEEEGWRGRWRWGWWSGNGKVIVFEEIVVWNVDDFFMG